VRKAYGSRLVIDAEDAKDLDIMQQFFAGLLEGQGLLGVELDAPISIAGPDMLVGLEKHRRALLESDAFLYPQQAEEFNTTSEPYTHPGWGWPYQGPWSLSVTDMWDQGHGDPGTVVAVLDTGIVEGSLPLFQNLKQGYDFVSYDDGQRDPDFFDDDSANCQHGTKMSSIIAAAFEEPGYFHPMAKNASLLPIRTVLCGGGSASDLADSVFWAIGEEIIGIPNNDAHASILSISLAGLGNCPSYVQSAFDKAAEKGVKVFVSAGNYHGNAKDYFPANCNNITAVVMASDYGGRISSFSNRYGTIAVPGETIPTLAVAGGSLTTTHSTGTSASTALAAGYTALGMGIYGNEFKITDNLHTFDPGEECKAEDCGAGLVTNAPQDTIWPLLYPQEVTCAVGSNTLTAEEICAANDANTCVEATNPTCRPVEVDKIAAGLGMACMLRSVDKGIVCFGRGSAGVTGTDSQYHWGSSTTNSINSLVAIDLGSGFKKAKHVSCSRNQHCCAVRQDDGLVCWGGNVQGSVLGSGTTNIGDGNNRLMSSLQPVNVGGNLYNAKEVGAGNKHTCVLTLENTVMCWGLNSNVSTFPCLVLVAICYISLIFCRVRFRVKWATKFLMRI